MEIKELLLEHYLAWQTKLREGKSWKDFSEYIGIDHVYLNKIYNGRRKPGLKTIQLFVDVLGDERFFDVVGLDRPDKYLAFTRRNWPSVPEELKKRIAEEIAPYTKEKPPDEPD